MIKLTASQNPVIKEIRSLRNKSSREEKGLFFIEGSRFVEEAVREAVSTAGCGGPGSEGAAEIRYIAISDTYLNNPESMKLIEPCVRQGIKIYNVTDSLFESISDTRNPQGILAVMTLKRDHLKNARLSGGILVLLDSIRDPGNMGTIIRTADAAGCAGVVVTEGCVDVYNPKVLRSTMGSVFHLPILHSATIEDAMMVCKEMGYKLCASHLEGSVSIYDADLSGDIAFVTGSEADGIGDGARRSADMLVRIPMDGRAESLNAAVATGIMIFEAVRQRKKL